MTKQEAAIKYITENYLEYNRLRHDIVSDKLQIRMDLEGSEWFNVVQNGSTVVQNGSELSFKKTTLNNIEREALNNIEQGYWREMTKHDINSIVCHCAQEYDANITSREVMTALQSDLIPDVHPLREYVLSCGEWTEEQPDWIDFVASQVKVKTSPEGDSLEDAASGYSLEFRDEGNNATPSYTTLHHTTPSADALWRACFKKWFVAMVASWMKDEVVNHQVLVLIGKQGIFKTTWLEHLIPPHLRAYACKLANSNDLNKDERLRIAEFGLISLDEIDSMNNRELNQLKSVITATDVNERAAYAYTKERRVRLASFCASGNRRDFLTDITGNRRWLPFEVEEIQNPFFTLLPYERMYAQAWALAQDPLFSYWFDLDEIEVLEEHNQHFRDESNEEQLLPILFDVPAEGKGEFMTTAQISERLVTYGNIKKPMALGRLGVVMGSMGYRSVTRGNRQARLRGWIVYQRDTEEIAANKKLLAKECVTV
ncbi:MAG: hypothetical protein IKB40_00975 [Paludibacteraceae bacterium]|nr:hypothetical protein [Paludibacteraceae bacterium]